MSSRPRTAEWPTLVVAAGVYGGWAAVTLAHAALPGWATVALLAWLCAWHGSLRHEAIHGHPFADRRRGDALAWAPLLLWLPYADYRSIHLRHHASPALTDPLDDPESFYVAERHWAAAGPVRRGLLTANRTLLGRLAIGPALVLAAYLRTAAVAVWRGEGRARRTWAGHLAGVALVVAWVVGFCRLPLGLYLLGAVYGATSLTLLRSFAEHRFVPGDASRSAVVEAGPLLALLFLNNNLHEAHHARPGLAWYRLPALARARSSAARAAAGAGAWAGYAPLARRHLLRPLDGPVHPGTRRPAEGLAPAA